jgi:hypothetical protein
MAEYFTRAEAEALLPTLEPLLREIQSLRSDLVEALERFETLQAKMQGNGHGHQAELQTLRTRLGEVRSQLEASIRQVQETGAQIKDPAVGLIDFPALYEDRVVFLCWRLDEGDRIRRWHEIDAGFAGRQPLED